MSLGSVKLDRTLITGRVTSLTPRCVIEEIALVNAWEDIRTLDSLIMQINTTLYRTVDVAMNVNTTELEKIAYFLNPRINWTLTGLHSALAFIKKFMVPLSDSTTLSAYIPRDFAFGLQTPDRPENMNACVLYRLCTHLHIQVHPSITMKEMCTELFVATATVPRLIKSFDSTGLALDFRRNLNTFAASKKYALRSIFGDNSVHNTGSLHKVICDADRDIGRGEGSSFGAALRAFDTKSTPAPTPLPAPSV